MIAEAPLIEHPPPQEQAPVLRIAGFLSVPMCGWNAHWGCTLQALRPFTNIDVEIGFGAWWDHSMSDMFEWATERNYRWILTMDYDSMFTAEHLSSLLRRFGENPHIDALAALQCKRGSEEVPLWGSCNPERFGEIKITEDAIPMDSAHFGLTLFRVECLAKMDKPWFLHIPDENGSYRTRGRIDPDMYFWKKWREAGNTIYIDPHVRIGHLQAMVTEFGEDFAPRHVHVLEWRARAYGGRVQTV